MPLDSDNSRKDSIFEKSRQWSLTNLNRAVWVAQVRFKREVIINTEFYINYQNFFWFLVHRIYGCIDTFYAATLCTEPESAQLYLFIFFVFNVQSFLEFETNPVVRSPPDAERKLMWRHFLESNHWLEL